MLWFESEGCWLVDFFALGGRAQDSSRRNIPGIHACRGTSLQEGVAQDVANEKADEPKDGAMLDGGEMAQRRASTVQQKKKREDAYAALQHAAGIHCLVEEWRDCEQLEPKSIMKMCVS